MRINGSVVVVPKWLKIVSLSVPIVFASFTILFAGHNMYLAVQDTTKRVVKVESRLDSLEIETVVAQHTNQQILAEILKKLDPENGEEMVMKIIETQKSLVEQLEKKLEARKNNKEK